MAKEYLVLIEDDEPVNVAEVHKESQVQEWAGAQPDRRYVKVEECT
jgi:hypothetical protein